FHASKKTIEYIGERCDYEQEE
ncbi:MAG: hypothetical protein H6Q92_708, partial [Nitrospirae bacterium]|nr:hypothetical protein [Nitrospirota bacterium]